MHKLSVIIVNYNVKYYIAQCLKSLQKSLSGLDAEVVVVDNHSSDGSVEYLSSHFPSVDIVANNHNCGFSAANNLGIRQTNSEYVLLLNPDTIVGENTVTETLAFMDEHEQCGALGVRMLKASGASARESRRGIPTPTTAFFKMIGLCDRFVSHRVLGKYYMGYLPWEKPNQIEVVSGAFCLLRRSALETVGLLDEDYFMYGEDIDLSYRLLKGGFENWYHPSAILHYKGASTEKTSLRYVHVFYKAMLIFYRKHFAGSSIFFTLPIYCAIYGKAFMALMGSLMKLIRNSLGFFHRRHPNNTHYIYIGREEGKSAFSRFAHRHGLTVLTPDEAAWDVQHRIFTSQPASDSYIVCDDQSFSYQEMLQIMKENESMGTELAVFHNDLQVLITAKEVFS